MRDKYGELVSPYDPAGVQRAIRERPAPRTETGRMAKLETEVLALREAIESLKERVSDLEISVESLQNDARYLLGLDSD